MTALDPKAAALAEADRIDARHAAIFWLTVIIEAGLIAAFLLLADFKDRTHVLLFIAAMSVYSTVALGVAGLNMRLEQSQRRMLEALKLRPNL
jgi:hypothetical protein